MLHSVSKHGIFKSRCLRYMVRGTAARRLKMKGIQELASNLFLIEVDFFRAKLIYFMLNLIRYSTETYDMN